MLAHLPLVASIVKPFQTAILPSTFSLCCVKSILVFELYTIGKDTLIFPIYPLLIASITTVPAPDRVYVPSAFATTSVPPNETLTLFLF